MTLDSYNIFGDEYHLFNMPLSPLPKTVSIFFSNIQFLQAYLNQLEWSIQISRSFDHLSSCSFENIYKY
ncbi:GH14330 [Drosophila grimshawi]|uniref:GH14330 n=1 Tax=Drosophila grimshawi TaxID=7222 RepID=B4JYN2_DROGR|nr:GH14330 [Drosophila grimshawi]